MGIMEFINVAAHNKVIELVILAIVFDTVFGVLRAVKEKRFNSCAGIDGAIRKVAMLISLVFMLAIDMLIKINLIGFIPETVRTYLGLSTVGVAEFFSLLYIAYEITSIFKNMALCGLPVKGMGCRAGFPYKVYGRAAGYRRTGRAAGRQYNGQRKDGEAAGKNRIKAAKAAETLGACGTPQALILIQKGR